MASLFRKSPRALYACLIAWGEIRRGNLLEAQKYLDLTYQLDPQCPLIERVRSEFNAGRCYN